MDNPKQKTIAIAVNTIGILAALATIAGFAYALWSSREPLAVSRQRAPGVRDSIQVLQLAY